jgi:hypothetical protein
VKTADDTLWRLHFEYRDSQGRRFSNEAELAGSEARLWKIGDTGRVLYDPAKPANSIWLGREGA